MTEAIIKEEVTVHFIGAMAARSGFNITIPKVDEGVDLVIRSSIELPSKFKKMRIISGKALNVQVKTTTEKQITAYKKHLVFDLKAKNYDNLIFWKNHWNLQSRGTAPLILILLVLPEQIKDWFEVDLTEKKYTLNGLFYWYYPDKNADFTDNKYLQRIKIPHKNKIDLDSFNKIYNLFFKI